MKKTTQLLVLSTLATPMVGHAVTANGFETSFYGFVKSSAMYSTEALASYNNVNLAAPTHAVAHTKSTDKTSRMSFQTQQSRAGVSFKKDKDLQGRLEFDFVDFNKSSPTVQMNPRVRIASITYQKDDYKFIIGQDWDLFSPVTAFTFDFVGLYFLSGNTGFFRQQAQLLKTNGNWELGAAVGMAGNNPGSTDNDLETGKAPSYSARISYALKEGRVGFSGIYSKLNYDVDKTHHESYGLNLFFEKKISNTVIKSEAYYGQNMANIATLALGRGNELNDVREFGGTLTITQKISEKNFLFGGAGMAKIDNQTKLASFAMNATTSVITNPGIKSNFVSRLGLERKITEDLSWMSEVSRYETNSKVSGESQLNIPYSFESGFTLRF